MKLVSDMTNDPIVIQIFGKAQPAGSKTAQLIYRKNEMGVREPVYKNGRPLITTRDANRKSEPWKETVAQEAAAQYRGPALDGPLSVEMIFFQARPKGHYGTGRNAGIVKDSAPAYPVGRPDVLKLARAIEDALTGVVYRDDARIVDERIAKRYGDRERVEIRIWPVQDETVQDLVAAGKVEPDRPDAKWEQLALLDIAA
jgi:Holliday junction resolvase RusA-like endonuclease